MAAVLLAGGLTRPVTSHAGGNVWYVAGPLGSDLNPCNAPNVPCNTINAAIAKAQAGDTLLVTGGGIYTGAANNDVVHVDKSLAISGGWDVTFTTRPYFTIIDGEHKRRGVYIEPGIDVDLSQVAVIWGSAFDGGGIYVGGGLIGNRLLVAQNRGVLGGGIAFIGTTGTRLVLFDSAVFGNEFLGAGGGLYVSGFRFLDPPSSRVSSAALFNVTISSNYPVPSFDEEHGTPATPGGGVAVEGGFLELSATTVAQNTIWDGTHFTGNQAGIYSNHTGNVLIGNTLVADGCSASNPLQFRSQGNNVERGNTCFFVQPPDRVNVNPLIYPLDVNPGPYPTATHALALTSPAIDAANAGRCLLDDQRGVSRPQGINCDVGAYERAPEDRPMGFITHPGRGFADGERCPTLAWNPNGRERPNPCSVDPDVLLRALLGSRIGPIIAPGR